MRVLTLFSIFLLSYSSSLASERAKVSEICNSAALIASRETGVPLDVLRAITLTETGRTVEAAFLPWPWTVNMEGVGKWFTSVNDARKYVDSHFSRGARSFDVGCFQINYRWHHHAFASIDDMLDPLVNARYAAKFLKELYQELGTWSRAAGAYHSRTPKYALKYRARFDQILASLEGINPVSEITPEIASAHTNLYPLLQLGQATNPGSLVPSSRPIGRFIDLTRFSPVLVSQ